MSLYFLFSSHIEQGLWQGMLKLRGNGKMSLCRIFKAPGVYLPWCAAVEEWIFCSIKQLKIIELDHACTHWIVGRMTDNAVSLSQPETRVHFDRKRPCPLSRTGPFTFSGNYRISNRS